MNKRIVTIISVLLAVVFLGCMLFLAVNFCQQRILGEQLANSEDQPLEDIQTVMQLGKRSELITKICLFGLAPLAFVYTFAMILCSGRNWKGLLLALAVLAAVCGIGYIVVNGITTIRLGYRDADPWLVTIRVAVRSGIAWVLGAVIAAVMMLVKKNKVEQ